MNLIVAMARKSILFLDPSVYGDMEGRYSGEEMLEGIRQELDLLGGK